MSNALDRKTLHCELIRDCVADCLTEPDALLWMVLLHTHKLRHHAAAIANLDTGPAEFAAATQRHAAEIVSSVWADVSHNADERSDYVYWYRQFNTQTPYEVLEDVPEALLPRLMELRDTLTRDSRVSGVVAED